MILTKEINLLKMDSGHPLADSVTSMVPGCLVRVYIIMFLLCMLIGYT